MMLDEPSCKKSLARYAHCRDPVMQKVIIKIIFSMLELPDLRSVSTMGCIKQQPTFVIQLCSNYHCFRLLWLLQFSIAHLS